MKRLLILLFMLTSNFCRAQVAITGVTAITGTLINKYKKFEIGVSLSLTYAHPYDYNQILVQAEFTSPSGEVITKDGFWYEPFTRCTGCPDPTVVPKPYKNCIIDWYEKDVADPNYLTPTSTNYPWRIRFAPNEVGIWSYKIKVYDGGVLFGTLVTSGTYTFRVFNSTEKGYIGVKNTGKNFVFKDDGTMFFPMGVNTNGGKKSLDYNRHPYRCNKEIIPLLNSTGGNLIRIMMNPENFQIEWAPDPIGDYSSRQRVMYDLDDIFETAEASNVYIQLCLDVQSELYNDASTYGFNPDLAWANNPYKTLLSVSSPLDFYTDIVARNFYLQRLRYICSRWGYSTRLFAYEMFNEVDQMDSGIPGGYYGNYNWQKVRDWHQHVVGVGKALDPNHLFTTSTANHATATYCYPPGANNGLFWLPQLDFVQEHDYTSDYNGDYQRNNKTLRDNSLFSNKPLFFGEYGLADVGGCTIYTDNFTFPSNPIYNGVEFHNTMWAQAFSAAAGPGLWWGGIEAFINPNSPCWGGQHRHFKSLSRMLTDNEDFYHNSYKVITNKCTGSGPNDLVTTPTTPGNCEAVWQSSDLSNPNYIGKGISTTAEHDIEVYGLKSVDKVLGWIHYKKNYWAEIGYGNSCGTGVKNPYPGSISVLTGQTATFRNMCKGSYKIEYYSTYPDIDADGNGDVDDGGVIATLTQTADAGCNGDLTFAIPEMDAIHNGTPSTSPLRLPDYGFRITKINDNWSHHPITISTSGDDQTVGGRIKAAANNIFYGGNDGFLHHLYPVSSNGWNHERLTDYTNNTKVLGDIAVDGNAQNVFFSDWNFHLHWYYYSGGSWNESVIDPNSAVSSGIGVNAAGTSVFYIGNDNKVHNYYYSGGVWNHQLLYNSPGEEGHGTLAVSPDGMNVFYRGMDDKLHHYSFSGSSWVHSIHWNVGEDAKGEIYVNQFNNRVIYRGPGNEIHLYDFNGSTWVHDEFTSNNGGTIQNDYISGGLAVSPDGSHVFYVAGDNYIHQRYYTGGSGATWQTWAHDYLVCYDQLNSSREATSFLACDGIGKVFFRNNSNNEVSCFLWDAGCDAMSPYFSARIAPTNNQPPANSNLDNANSKNLKMDEESNMGSASSVISFNANGTYADNFGIKLYPNPFTTEVNVEFNKPVDFIVELQNIIGQTISKEKINGDHARINTAEILPGMYTIVIKNTDGQNIKVFKITKR